MILVEEGEDRELGDFCRLVLVLGRTGSSKTSWLIYQTRSIGVFIRQSLRPLMVSVVLSIGDHRVSLYYYQTGPGETRQNSTIKDQSKIRQEAFQNLFRFLEGFGVASCDALHS